jgi:hypothetical protein
MQVGVANLFIFMICIFANFEQLLLSIKVVFWGEMLIRTTHSWQALKDNEHAL